MRLCVREHSYKSILLLVFLHQIGILGEEIATATALILRAFGLVAYLFIYRKYINWKRNENRHPIDT